MTTMSDMSTSSLLRYGFWISMRTVPTSQSSQKLTEKLWSIVSAVSRLAGQLAACARASLAPSRKAAHTTTGSRMLPSTPRPLTANLWAVSFANFPCAIHAPVRTARLKSSVRAVPLPLGFRPRRPVTLRHHLSVVLPF